MYRGCYWWALGFIVLALVTLRMRPVRVRTGAGPGGRASGDGIKRRRSSRARMVAWPGTNGSR
jgi:hypothetical protein